MCAGECECLCAHTPVQIYHTYICGFDELVVGAAQIQVQKPHLLEQWCLVVAPVAGGYL